MYRHSNEKNEQSAKIRKIASTALDRRSVFSTRLLSATEDPKRTSDDDASRLLAEERLDRLLTVLDGVDAGHIGQIVRLDDLPRLAVERQRLQPGLSRQHDSPGALLLLTDGKGKLQRVSVVECEDHVF